MEYQLSLVHDDEEERIAKAIKEVQYAKDAEQKMKDEEKKNQIEDFLSHRLKMLDAAAIALNNRRKEDKEALARNIAADDKAHKEDEEKRAKQLEERKRLAQLYREGMVRRNNRYFIY